MSPDAKRVLCAEPVSDICRLVALMLGQKGYETDSAGTAAEAVEMALSGEYCLHLVAESYPDGTGAELTRKLREAAPHVPILVFSSHAFERDRMAAMEAGANAFLTKPVGIASLADMVVHLCGVSPAGQGILVEGCLGEATSMRSLSCSPRHVAPVSAGLEIHPAGEP